MKTSELLINRNIAVNGKVWLLNKCAEECVELAGAILKHFNKGESEKEIQAEIADVEIAIEHLSLIYGRELIDNFKLEKIDRIERRIEEKEAMKC